MIFSVTPIIFSLTACTIFRPGSIGRDLPGFHTKLDTSAPGVGDISPGAGELCMRGRNVFMGYLGAEEKTREVFDTEGWHHSGDVGTRDDEGYFTITGEFSDNIVIKLLLITNYCQHFRLSQKKGLNAVGFA